MSFERPALWPPGCFGGRLIGVNERMRIRDIENEKARRRAAREMVEAYHEEQLLHLLDHVRDGFARMDRGEIDAFELDDLIQHYKRSAQKLWSFCGSSGSAWENAALTVEWWRERGEPEADWWEAGNVRRRSDN
jgi:hypothetical protein